MAILPYFKYHPHALANRCIIASDTPCVCCGLSRGYRYSGPAYSAEDYDDCICPWCIFDGLAHERLGVEFNDREGLSGFGEAQHVPAEVVDEIVCRTPGFSAWQQPVWWAHCNDAAQFLCELTLPRLDILGPDAEEAARIICHLDGPNWKTRLNEILETGSPGIFLFQCNRCGAFGGYDDWD